MLHFQAKPLRPARAGEPQNMKRIRGVKGSRIQVKGLKIKTLESLNLFSDYSRCFLLTVRDLSVRNKILAGRVAQRESIGLTSRGSQVQILFRLPLKILISAHPEKGFSGWKLMMGS
jgi:hypothetical protein